MTSKNWPPLAVYTDNCNFPSSISNLPEIGLPSASLARKPASSETVASFRAAARAGAFFAASAASAFSEPLVSWAWAEAILTAKPNAIIAIHRFFMTLSSLCLYGGREIRPDMIFRKKLDQSFHNHEHQATSHPSQDARTIRL